MSDEFDDVGPDWIEAVQLNSKRRQERYLEGRQQGSQWMLECRDLWDAHDRDAGVYFQFFASEAEINTFIAQGVVAKPDNLFRILGIFDLTQPLEKQGVGRTQEEWQRSQPGKITSGKPSFNTMNTNKTNILELVPFTLALLLFGGLAIIGWITGAIVQALLTSALTVLVLVILVGMFRQGFRAPTPYERFKAWMVIRPVIVGLIGAGIVVVAVRYVFPATEDWPEEGKAALILIPLLFWVAALFYSLSKAPNRNELDAAYKRRVGYKEKE